MNLANACDALKTTISGEVAREGSSWSSTVEAFVAAAEDMLEEDIAANRRQGQPTNHYVEDRISRYPVPSVWVACPWRRRDTFPA